MSKKVSHLSRILIELIEGKTLHSIDQKASNTNQYFRTIKNNGIELVEVWQPNLTNTGRHKARSLHQTHENIKRAKTYLKKIQGELNV